MPLAQVKSGLTVKLVSIDAGRKLCARLADMGLTPGVEIDVISNSNHGPFLVAVRGSRVAIGRGMASKINVN